LRPRCLQNFPTAPGGEEVLGVGLRERLPRVEQARLGHLVPELGPDRVPVLTLNLRKLERDGLLVRTVYPTVPPKVEYRLTPIARELGESFATLTAWAERHRRAIAAARTAYDHRPGGPAS
jgi:DNA-binding HxlR family transcriptional regulator